MKTSPKLSTEAGRKCESASKAILLLAIGAYRTLGTSILGGSCRFEPSCSAYAVEAVRLHAPVRAIYLIVRRLAKCRPGGPFGFDPVPPAPVEIRPGSGRRPDGGRDGDPVMTPRRRSRLATERT